jgi:hypothetical protein
MVNRGEVVVNCVVNRGGWKTLFSGRKFSSFLKNIFALVRRWESREQQIPPLRCGMTTKGQRIRSDDLEGNDNQERGNTGVTTLRYIPKSGQSSCQTLSGR